MLTSYQLYPYLRGPETKFGLYFLLQPLSVP